MFFNQNLKTARNTDLPEKERFEALAHLSQLINHTEGVKGKTAQSKKFRERKLAGQEAERAERAV